MITRALKHTPELGLPPQISGLTLEDLSKVSEVAKERSAVGDAITIDVAVKYVLLRNTLQSQSKKADVAQKKGGEDEKKSKKKEKKVGSRTSLVETTKKEVGEVVDSAADVDDATTTEELDSGTPWEIQAKRGVAVTFIVVGIYTLYRLLRSPTSS
jgi:hypothetical protein